MGGMSMGGYCAVDQGLRHPEEFATILSFMPYGAPGQAGRAMKSSQDEIDAVSPTKYIPSLTTLERYPVAAWFGIGDAEVDRPVGHDAVLMAELLREKGQIAQVYIAPHQGHTWKMTITSLPEALCFWQYQLDLTAAAAIVAN
jgi:S-formylglutathione hydrolase FrmB